MTQHTMVNIGSVLFRLMIIIIASWKCTTLEAQSIDFDRQIAPILVSDCLECHQGDEPEGGLNLTERTSAIQGGQSGAAIVVGNATQSLLWERVSSNEMPPVHPLGREKKAVLKRWIEEGAYWSQGPLDLFSITTDRRAGRDWWSLQPLRDVSVPTQSSNWVYNEIDAFILRRLEAVGVQPSAKADPRTLIRRLYFDLIGLPPTPKQVAAFVDNPSEAAYEQVVDDLLASKHYGERWGRHWLDVVRFGESDGFERNFQRENAWHYRDWVIDAFNNDMPYNEFVRMQLVGDDFVGGVDGAAATGFWVAGVHNTTVGGSKRMKQLARQDEIEEVLATVGQAFVGLTINCARCHDHKFDPVSQTEYYQLASAISGLGFGNQKLPVPKIQAIVATFDEQLADVRKERAMIDNAARDRVIASQGKNEPNASAPPQAMARWEFNGDLKDSIGTLHGTAHGNAYVENGALVLDGKSFVETIPLIKNLSEKTLEVWVQLETINQRGGAAISVESKNGDTFDAIVFGEREPKRWMTGSNNFIRTDSFGGAEEKDAVRRPIHIAIVYQKDGRIICYRDGDLYGHAIGKSHLQHYKAGETEILFGLRHKPAGGNQFLKGKIHQAALYDRVLTPDEIAANATNAESISESELIAALDVEERARRTTLNDQIAELTKQRDRHAGNAVEKIYTLVTRQGEVTNVLLRGDPDNAGEVVSPAATAAIDGLSADFGLAPDAPEVERRRKLSEWITNDKNPLFARVIVNRIWHYHFGTGIVDTPGDFGFNGGRPSHPDLLDYLAKQFRQNGLRLKWLHRLIVRSSTYQQAVQGRSKTDWQHAVDTDAANRFLWRGNVRRLEAESLRDAILYVSGQLNDRFGGPSFKDVSVTLNSGTTYYEPIDVDGPDFFRRTVYRFNPRGGRSALLDTFDCPDPASAAPRRSVTTTPLQSLSLMNNPLVIRMADYFAQRVIADVGDNGTQQVDRAWQLAIARHPTDSERRLSESLIREHGLSALCRGLFNINEFVAIE